VAYSRPWRGAQANVGVQGAAGSYRNTLTLHRLFGFEPTPVKLTCSFGRGLHNWTNYADSELASSLRSEIKAFQRCLEWVSCLEVAFAFVDIDKVLSLWQFSDDFRYRMVYPLVALFFGTGNTTPRTSAAIIARVFLDPQLRLFDYSPDRLLDQSPDMYAFDDLTNIYATIVEKSPLKAREWGARVTSVERHKSHVMVTWSREGTEVRQQFDAVVFACPADVALRILGDGASRLERMVLSSVKYYDDVSITHTDKAYMEKHYQCNRATDMYFIKTHPKRMEKLEMAFTLTNYQPHLREMGEDVYQSIFLDKRDREELWTDTEIDPAKIISKDWWHAFAHEATHYRDVVPWMPLLQGQSRTLYAGSWTVANTHEMATISGLAAAWRLGAAYPFEADEAARAQFDTYLKVSHGIGHLRRRGSHATGCQLVC